MTHWGPELREGADTMFRLWAPDRDAVTLEIDGASSVTMDRDGEGWFSATAPAPAGTRYRFRLDKNLAVPDPAARLQAGGVHGWSVVVDPAFAWSATEWRGRPWEETVLLEVHAGTLGGFEGIRRMLPAIAASGITAIELMPVNAFGGTRNWGYDGVLPYAVAEPYGSPAELKTLVDTAHGLGLSVFLDVVYNHFGPDGNYLNAYASAFFHKEVDTPWGGAVAVDADPVHRFFVDNALMWLGDYRIDGLRFDAVHAIENDGFLDRMAHEIRAALPERHVHLVLENEKNDTDRLRAACYDAQWNDDFHNVLHVLLTGETSAYYGDFADNAAERLARCLKEGFIYQGEGSPNHDGKPRGKPSGDLPSTAFVAFLQNHDQVGNRAMGERLVRLTDRERLRAATALLLLGPQIPLLFMGEDEGSESPFLFFTDFHDELADAVREGRRREFAKFDAFADEEARKGIPDPNARSTFDASIPRPGPQAGEWRALYRDLLALRHVHIMPRLKGTVGLAADVTGPGRVKARWRMADGATLTILIDLGDAPEAIVGEAGQLIYWEGDRFAAWIAE
ncbi:malto-oligosyltrehalose trehalohydrolase [Sphingomonas sp. Sph1(2015)]|jgi:maltooligosyltrehalose trehalohydrolase|uniref:malto-oligosyltrehalose trehalohydrolase n=1 Tax=Sphingomonas sp. Sph1(2015) TaxID=1628084 RepID=UPI0009784AC2|nr:malto-oligosyltrehalose trehalohydrolase [Sphingomonas sp. Sph1(2015)]OMJ32893.1 malto-oligosyltrehalose trehalohydrolase [Sphingomonas sp. Sph1(2015)]